MVSSAAIYVRISQDSEDKGLGVKRQERECRAKLKQLGWPEYEVYRDNDISASSGAPREQYLRMVRDVERGIVDAVIVWEVDRLTRTPRELEDVIDWADKYRLALASVGGQIDLGTPSGRMTARVRGVVARYEVEQSGARLQAKHRELAEAGVHSGSRPFGWDLDKNAPGGLRINEDEAALVRRLAADVLAGKKLWTLARELNEAGVKTPRRGQWRPGVVKRMLLKKANVAVREHQRSKKVDGKLVRFGPKLEYPAQWEPILDDDTYERLTAILTDPARRTNRGTEAKWLLTSIAHCGVCGGYLAGAGESTVTLKNGRSRTYPARYRCINIECLKITREMAAIDAHVTEVALTVLERDGVRLLGGDVRALEEASAKVEAEKARLTNAASMFADGSITADQLATITSGIRPRLEAAERARQKAMPKSHGVLDDMVGESAREAWERADLERRKAALRAIGLDIRIMPLGSGNGGGAFDKSKLIITREPDAEPGSDSSTGE